MGKNERLGPAKKAAKKVATKVRTSTPQKARKGSAKAQVKPQREPKDWDMRRHRTWGNNIEHFQDWRFVGWTTPAPEVGDRIICRLRSGRYAALVITDVRHEYNVGDMWWADVDPDSMEVVS